MRAARLICLRSHAQKGTPPDYPPLLATSHFSESQNGFIELPLHALSAHPQAENGAKTFKKDEPAAFLQDIFALLLN